MSVPSPSKTLAMLPQSASVRPALHTDPKRKRGRLAPSSLALRVSAACGRERSGSILAIVLASLLVASMLGLALIETILVQNRQIHVTDRQQQCFWLAEAGIQRAVQRLADSPDYQGETWEVSAGDLGGARSAVVVIRVTPAAGSPPAREIVVEARLSGDPRRAEACRRTWTVAAPPASAATSGNAESERNGGKEARPSPKNDSGEE